MMRLEKGKPAIGKSYDQHGERDYKAGEPTYLPGRRIGLLLNVEFSSGDLDSCRGIVLLGLFDDVVADRKAPRLTSSQQRKWI